MGRDITKEDLKRHKEEAILKFSAYMDSLIDSSDPKLSSKGDKLSYWLKDWSNFLEFENQFNPRSLRRYKRGEIIKLHLGFNVGSEEGGLHYAVVLDKQNAKSSPVVTVIPLTSVKPNTDIQHLRPGHVFLGNELFTSLNAKISATTKHLWEEIHLLESIVDDDQRKIENPEELVELSNRIQAARKEQNLLERMRSEIFRMKKGSIALVGQITTVSKIRIYDPKTDHGILSGVKLSNEKLDLIDQELNTLFIK
ncbi:MAG: type II toxin-antitoxin system PemK/MazF family toxin [Clostridiales bacterium]|nr:type II toxin-antitoxin system PemK/MazF family toxin [Clostridiales bacterium]